MSPGSSAPLLSARAMSLALVLGGAINDKRLAAVGHAAQGRQEFHAAHQRHLPIEQNHVGHGGLAGIEGGLAGVGLTAVEREPLEDVPGNFSDDVGIIDHETGLHGEPTEFLAVDRLPHVDRGIAAIRRKPEGEINFALPAGARQPLGLAANRISPPSRLIARRMRAEAANRQVK
jgi:hypothetical protein